MYTDGVTECFSPENEAFGENRLIETLQGCIGMEVEEMLNIIVDALAQFRSTAPVSDDMTLLAIRRL
jgi:sigma-B regulation protein RsbU (phosphoserine phosphatase)